MVMMLSYVGGNSIWVPFIQLRVILSHQFLEDPPRNILPHIPSFPLGLVQSNRTKKLSFELQWFPILAKETFCSKNNGVIVNIVIKNLALLPHKITREPKRKQFKCSLSDPITKGLSQSFWLITLFPLSN